MLSERPALTSFLIEFEDELAHRKMGPACEVLAAHRRETAAISIMALGEFAEGFSDPRALVEFLAPFRVVTLSRAIAWHTAALQSCSLAGLGRMTPGSQPDPASVSLY